MHVRIYDAKLRQDEMTARYLQNAIANIYFYHGTTVKVNTYDDFVNLSSLLIRHLLT